MYETQKEKMKQAIHYLNDEKIDVWLIYTSEGSDPCLPLVTGVKTVGPGAFLFHKSGEKIAITSAIDAQDVRESKLFDHVFTYKNGLAKELSRVIGEWNPQTIALNKSKHEHLADGLTAGRMMWLKTALKDVFKGEYVSAAPFLKKLRSIKTDAEIEKIKKAISLTHDIYDDVFQTIRAGMTEKEMGQLFVIAMEERGLVNGIDRTLSMPIVMKDNIAHRGPSDRVVEKGELVIFDFSVDYEGYVSDIARTVYFLKDGESQAPVKMQRTFQTIHEAITLAGNQIKPGVVGYTVDQVAREHLVKHGFPEIEHATGHQIGQDVHDGGALLGPRWKRYGDAPYEPLEIGNVFTIEPTVFLREEAIHFIVEENVVVKDDGIDYLSKRQNELILI